MQAQDLDGLLSVTKCWESLEIARKMHPSEEKDLESYQNSFEQVIRTAVDSAVFDRPATLLEAMTNVESNEKEIYDKIVTHPPNKCFGKPFYTLSYSEKLKDDRKRQLEPEKDRWRIAVPANHTVDLSKLHYPNPDDWNVSLDERFFHMMAASRHDATVMFYAISGDSLLLNQCLEISMKEIFRITNVSNLIESTFVMVAPSDTFR